MASRTRRRRPLLAVGIGLLVCFALLVGVGVVVRNAFFKTTPLPMSDQCVIADGHDSTTLLPDQSRYAAMIVGLATKRGLPPRAGIIALATALQESRIQNLDYGDRDSVGLFQQRPSQGWGTEAQLMDPVYATNKFYDALVKVDDWETGDINDVAQEVQRSGVPDGYRKHVERATLLGDVFAGQGGTVRCLDRTPEPGNAAGYVELLQQVYGVTGVTAQGQRVSFDAASEQRARAFAFLAVAHTHTLGVVSTRVGDQIATTGSETPLPWAAATPAGEPATHVELVFRS